MNTLLTAPDEMTRLGFDFSNSHIGELGAHSVRYPKKLPDGAVFSYGAVANAGAVNETNAAVAELDRIYADPDYRENLNPSRHDALKERARFLFQFLHP